jgi:hypothetical protein
LQETRGVLGRARRRRSPHRRARVLVLGSVRALHTDPGTPRIVDTEVLGKRVQHIGIIVARRLRELAHAFGGRRWPPFDATIPIGGPAPKKGRVERRKSHARLTLDRLHRG